MSAQSLLNTPNITFENIVTPTIQTNTINSSNTLSLNSAQAIDLNSTDPIVLTAPDVSISTLLVSPTIETDAINSNNGLNINSTTGTIMLKPSGSNGFDFSNQLGVDIISNANNLNINSGGAVTLISPDNISLNGISATAPAVALSTNNTQIATTASVLSLLGSYIQFGIIVTNGNAPTTINFPVAYTTAPVVVFSGSVPDAIVWFQSVNGNSFTIAQNIPGAGNLYWIAIGSNPIIA